jgi:hypothetical protein
MGKKTFVVFALAVVCMLLLPALASATLVNEYGMHYAGQDSCVSCHSHFSQGSPLRVSPALHGRFATEGVSPAVPEGWTEFQAAGNVSPLPGEGQSVYHAGGSYSLTKLAWITLGDASEVGNSATEYLFFRGADDPTVMPWNIIEGLAWEPAHGGEWMVAAEDPGTGLFDESYACQRCHMLGSTVPGTSAVPNPAASIQPNAGTARQWARMESDTVEGFMSDASVSMAGLGIQCEQCHGTGMADKANGHTNTGVDISSDLEVLGKSQVCGQCHGSYTNASGTMGIYGYTTNLALRDFVDINGASGGQSYTKIPTEEEFAASPAAYWMFPNGSNAKGNHYYYNEWAASAHSYRPALTKDDPDAMTFQAAGNGHYSNNFDPNLTTGCYKCHTGEGYLQSKGARIASGLALTKDNVGMLGQECSSCHNGHPSGIGASDVVRDPDKAGVRSAKGLSVDNESICEDCHNWQMEVLGQSPKPAPMADLAAHGGPSHPQRETLHGRSVMSDTAAGKDFMPGAECEDCHMPKTNKAATRISHGMKPMLPGDAERWNGMAGGAYQGEDSCTGCHPSRSRSQLQVDIDEWQEDAEAKAAAVAAAIAAAKTRSEFSATDTTKPGYELVARATWNYKAFENDASEGVHNPPYIMAGLSKAEQMAKSVGGRFSYTAASSSVRKGKTAHVAGRILNGDGSNAAGGEVVLLRGTKVLDTAVADAKGHFACTFKVTKTYKNYKVKWVRSSSSLTSKLSKAMTIKVRR